MKKLLAILALGAVYYYAQAKEFLKEYTVKFIDAKIDFVKTRDSGFARIFFTMRIRVSNTTDFTGVLQSGYLVLSYQGKKVGESVNNDSIEIKPHQDLDIKIPVTVESLKLVQSIPAMFQMLTATRKIKFHVDGILKFKIGDYKISQEYTAQI